MSSTAPIIAIVISAIVAITGILKFAFKKQWTNFLILCLVSAIIFCLGIGLIAINLNTEIKKLQTIDNQKKQTISELETNNKQLRDKIASCPVLGTTEPSPNDESQGQTISDFIRDWETNDFYHKGDGIFCPYKGNFNYQRMYYQPQTSLVNSKLDLKFVMVDENTNQKQYSQRMVVGTGTRENLRSEFDIPTRNGEVVNIREASESNNLVPKPPGKQISSPIKEGETINLSLESKPKVGSEITQSVTLGYISKIPEKGDEYDTISGDFFIKDTNPENGKSSFFLGSYAGGCIQIINWSVVSSLID